MISELGVCGKETPDPAVLFDVLMGINVGELQAAALVEHVT
jgi:hypothetical protein